MAEPERWKTPRRCPKCMFNDDKYDETIYLFAQPWGQDKEGHPMIKLDCLKCGHHEEPTVWSGH